jgi:hypothetical protein
LKLRFIPAANIPGIIHLRTFIVPCNAPIRFKESMNTADVMKPLFVGPPECSCHTDVTEFYIQNLPSFDDVRASISVIHCVCRINGYACP